MSNDVLSERVGRVGMSATLAVSDAAKKLRAEGVDVLNFSVGEPDHPTPDAVKEAGKKAIDANHTKYTASAGIIELRRSIATKLKRDNGLEYAPSRFSCPPAPRPACTLPRWPCSTRATR